MTVVISVSSPCYFLNFKVNAIKLLLCIVYNLKYKY